LRLRPSKGFSTRTRAAIRRRALTSAALVIAVTSVSQAQQKSPARRGDVVYEASITELQAAMAAGRVTAVELVDGYLARIKAYDHAGPALNAMVRLNPRAHADAAALDAERKAGKVRGPLHGIPIILKDNYATRDLETSAGSIALGSLRTPDDAFQVKKLRDAGAVILGKSNMHELASGITTISSVGGQTCNPYDPDRNPGGSSGGSGVAVAASYAAVAWGSDTCGSIRIPSAVHNLFGLRPTKGLSSIDGIVPLSHTQDVGGPIARSVMDLAIALDATIGPDPKDSATKILDGKPPIGFVASLDSTSLRGARLGILTSAFGTEADDQEGTRIVRAALEKMKARGATVIDVTVPGLDSIVNRASVIDYEFKYDLIDYLAAIPNAPVKSLGEILDRGLYDVALEAGLRRRERNGTRDGEAYRAALARRTDARNLIVSFLDANKLDALVYPTLTRKAAIIGEPQRGSTCQFSAVTGLPALAMPAGFTADGLPIGVELLGMPLSDPRLVSLTFDYEQSARPRRPPSTTPPLEGGIAPSAARFTATIRDRSTVVSGSFAFDPMRRTLQYSVALTGLAADRVLGISIDRDSAGKKGPVLHHLSNSGITKTSGFVKFGESDRRDLLAGHLSLVVYTSNSPSGALKSPISPVGSR
jgi:Asp-tRNA(Asn)/Glu-tRNA(Gln) amidotransferase A subunit family amidase